MRKTYLYVLAGFFLSFSFIFSLAHNISYKEAKAVSSVSLPVRTVALNGHVKDEDGNVSYVANTYESFLRASEMDFYGIECDIYKTSDNHFVTYDYYKIDISEPLNTDESTGNWKTISSLTKDELVALNIGTISNPAHMCDFSDYLRVCKDSGKCAFINLKDFIEESVLQTKILDYVNQNGMSRKSTFLSYNATNLVNIINYERATNRGYKVHLLTNESRTNSVSGALEVLVGSDWLSAAEVLGYGASISINYAYFDHTLVDLSSTRNLDTSVWTVNDASDAEDLINLGVDLIFTDELETEKSYLSNYAPYVIQDTDDWAIEDGGKQEIIRKDGDNSYLIQNINTYGERIRYKELLLLDGLSFTIKIDDFRGLSDDNYSNVGFYFSSWNERYAFTSNDYASFAFLSNKYKGSPSQDRFGIYDSQETEDIINNTAKTHVAAYSDESLTKKGFGYDDGSLIMSHRPVTGLHFDFEKYNNTLYKVTVTELYSGVIWNYETGKTANYDNGSTFVYVEASRFDLDANGRTYLFLYSVDKNNFFDFDKHVVNINQNASVVKFVTNTDTLISDLYIKPGSKIVTMPEVKREGYNLEGWYTRSDFSKKFNPQSDVITSNSLTLFAKWQAKTYKATFVTNSDSTISEQTIAYNGTITKPNNPEKEGYRFVGWYTDEELENEFSFKKKIKNDITLYAKYEAIDNYYTPLILSITLGIVGFVAVAGFVVLYVYRSSKLFNAKLVVNKTRKEFKEKNKE